MTRAPILNGSTDHFTAKIFVEFKCDSCGRLLSSELFRPSVLAAWDRVAAWWQSMLTAHVDQCPGRRR